MVEAFKEFRSFGEFKQHIQNSYEIHYWVKNALDELDQLPQAKVKLGLQIMLGLFQLKCSAAAGSSNLSAELMESYVELRDSFSGAESVDAWTKRMISDLDQRDPVDVAHGIELLIAAFEVKMEMSTGIEDAPPSLLN